MPTAQYSACQKQRGGAVCENWFGLDCQSICNALQPTESTHQTNFMDIRAPLELHLRSTRLASDYGVTVIRKKGYSLSKKGYSRVSVL
mmetsp:Transcript_9168/g.19704  ORF Transcript_9168/g.19704 Transcript_9168/m.19704 type:complete len:88 (+) Transcript_9168:3021-3284(+)